MRKVFLKISLLVIVFVVSTLSKNDGNLENFIVITELKKNFQEAEGYCKANKMDLVRGESPKFLRYILSRNINDHWIDVHFSDQSSNILHADLTTIKRTNWAPGEPKRCVVVSKSKAWRYISCDTLNFVVCKNQYSINKINITGLKKNFQEAEEYCKTHKMDLVGDLSKKELLYILSKNLSDFWIKSTFLATFEPRNCVVAKDKLWRSISCATLSPVVCTKGFLDIGQFLYEDGYQECKKYGYNLVRADTQESAIDVYNFDLSSNLGIYWIDANDIENEGTWVHHDGTPSANDLWAPGEPNGGTAENCAAANYIIDYAWRWIDLTCNTNSETICQI